MVKVEVFLVIILVWNIVLSYLVWRIARELSQFSKGIDKKSLKALFKENKEIEKKINQLEEANKFCFQKASLVKFNPFSELGGDQSFSIALLDDQNQGIVITSLHGRQATRLYTKIVGDENVKLSEEEKKAIKLASKQKR